MFDEHTSIMTPRNSAVASLIVYLSKTYKTDAYTMDVATYLYRLHLLGNCVMWSGSWAMKRGMGGSSNSSSVSLEIGLRRPFSFIASVPVSEMCSISSCFPVEISLKEGMFFVLACFRSVRMADRQSGV